MSVENLKIGTWNITNSKFNLSKNKVKVDKIIELLYKEELDVLCLQEVNSNLASKINRKLKKAKSKYKITTKYRHHLNPVNNLKIEYNTIISRFETATNEMKNDLPFCYKGVEFFKYLFKLHKRNMVGQLLKYDSTTKKYFIINNTNLELLSEKLRKRQLDKVCEYIRQQTKLGLDIVLAGTLNGKPIDKIMLDFSQELSGLRLKILINKNSSYLGSNDNMTVDYIVVPSSWDVESTKTLKDYEEVSSHNPVIAKVVKR